MEKLKNKKILTIIVLVVAIVGLSVGFAAFSSVLTISSTATVKPDASTFSIKFSKVSDSVLDGEANLVYPSSGNGEGGLIDNTTNPTITGLKANFKAPGESVVYTFYVRNEGEFLAYLNSIEIGSKSCTPGTGADPTLVSNACDAISISVKVGSMEEIKETTEEIYSDFYGTTLSPGSYQEVIVTLAYDENGARADGPFSLKLGDIKLTYSSVSDLEFTPSESAICTLSTETTGDGYTTGTTINSTEIVTCGSEQFYVMENDGTNITMLAKYGLSTSAEPYLQSATDAGPMSFWESTPEVLPEEESYIYDTFDNNIRPYVEIYENYLINTLEMTGASARLASLEDLENLGLSAFGDIPKDMAWLYSVNFWLGTSSTMDDYMATMHIVYYSPYDNRGAISYHGPTNIDSPANGYMYIRPLIEIPTGLVG